MFKVSTKTDEREFEDGQRGRHTLILGHSAQRPLYLVDLASSVLHLMLHLPSSLGLVYTSITRIPWRISAGVRTSNEARLNIVIS